ncbi:MAG: ribosomal RNA small subunit methyltransferase A [Parcubacteria group bacterium]|nr:ribosomal RNA small subunit methyltransferase A [Parcubacteria group bacterium]
MKINRRLGQHFLVSQEVLDKIIQASRLSLRDTILEIGPGRGALTEELVKRVKKVVAVEKDGELAKFLRKKFGEEKNLKIIHADILKINPSELGFESRNFKIVANIPYYLTGKLLREIFERWPRPSLMVLMLQKEVAERLTTKPPKMNLLAISVQYFSKPKIIAAVPKTAFRPAPEVDSAIVKFLPKSEARNPKFETRFFELVKTGFRQPRKLLASNLAKKYQKDKVISALGQIGIKTLARPSELSLKNWQDLTKALA